MKKYKVLLLGNHDSKQAGHIQYMFNHMPANVEPVMVTRFGLYGNAQHCFWPMHGKGLSFFEKIKKIRYSRHFFFIWQQLYCFFHYGIVLWVDKRHPEYSYQDFEFVPYSASEILAKCPPGFSPDVIIITYCARFISSKIIKDLHQKTRAKIVYSFVDEAPMTGGCHYPNECTNYLHGCNNCPALKMGRIISHVQMINKEKNLSDIPLYILGSPYDMRIAKKTKVFKNAIPIPAVLYPQVTITNQIEARKELGIPMGKYVVMIGATDVKSVRKGFSYSVGALNIFSKKAKDVLILVLGKKNEDISNLLPGMEIIQLGFVTIDVMVKAFCSADCFLSSTIADSGPQMVNYSIATGTPVVSFSIGIAEDLVIHKKTGYIARFKDSTDLASGLLYLHDMGPKSRDVMSRMCIETIAKLASQKSWEDILLT